MLSKIKEWFATLPVECQEKFMLNNNQSLVLDDFKDHSKKYHKAFLKYMESDSNLEDDLKRTAILCYLIEEEIYLQLNLYLGLIEKEKKLWQEINISWSTLRGKELNVIFPFSGNVIK